MEETVHNVLLLVRDNQPAGVEGLLAEHDFTGWTWEVAGGPFCLVTAPDGATWAFEPDVDTYWDRITDRVHGAPGHLMGRITQVANLDEWQGLAAYAARLEDIRLQAIAATLRGAGSTRINRTIQGCLAAGQAAYAAIIGVTCPWLAATAALSSRFDEVLPPCRAVFTGTEEGILELGEVLIWTCHRESGHAGVCDAAHAVTWHCCVPKVLSSVSSVVSPPYERGPFWPSFLPQPAADLAV